MNAVAEPTPPEPGVQPVVESAPPAPARIVDHPFEFNGNATEYFRIWIVNMALSIVTLGIYSAWSKVRTQRYFYANTRAAGFPFEYLAKPIPILKGRILAFVLFGSYVISGQFSLKLQVGLAGLIALLSPWLIVRGLRFRARYTAWRSLSFRFAGTYGDAYVKYLLMFLLVPLTLGIYFPFLKAHQKRYVVEGHRYGTQPFTFSALNGDFFPPYLAAFGMMIGWYVLVFILFMAFASVVISGAPGHRHPNQWLMFGMIGFMYFGVFMIFVYISSRVNNLVYNNMRIGPVRFQSSLRAWELIGLYIVNTLGILVSCGMLIPWAMVRMAKYRASRLVLQTDSSLDAFSAAPQREEGAGGSELDAVFDIDIGF